MDASLFTVAGWLALAWGQPSEGNIMKRLFATALFVLGGLYTAPLQAQEFATPATLDGANVAGDFATTSAAKVSLVEPLDLNAGEPFSPAVVPSVPIPGFSAVATVSTSAAGSPELPSAPAPKPAPAPKYIYGGRDDYRWQLALGIIWIRFQSSIFKATAVGVQTSVSYFMNDWLGVEGSVSAVFAPEIYDKEHVKMAVYGGGPRISSRQGRWEPFIHALFGGAHEQPQTAGNTRDAFSIQGGFGVDYRLLERVSARIEGDYVRTTFFKQTQNNFQGSASIVIHF
jgi:hypothetical protein